MACLVYCRRKTMINYLGLKSDQILIHFRSENLSKLFLSIYLKGLGKLAEKFPLYAKQSVDCLREFLTNPSKILTRLHRQYLQDRDKNPPQVMVTQSDRLIFHIFFFFVFYLFNLFHLSSQNCLASSYRIVKCQIWCVHPIYL